MSGGRTVKWGICLLSGVSEQGFTGQGARGSVRVKKSRYKGAEGLEVTGQDDLRKGRGEIRYGLGRGVDGYVRFLLSL